MKVTPLRTLVVLVILAIIAVGAWQLITVQKAHSSFDNYYAFRGCEMLLEKTDTYGTCRIKSGQTIKMVAADGGWYLDGDLPCPGPKFTPSWFACVL